MAAIVVGLLAVAVLCFRDGSKSNNDKSTLSATSPNEVAEGRPNAASQSSQVAIPKPTEPLPSATEVKGPGEVGPDPDAQLMDERRQELNQRRELAQQLQKKSAGESLARLETLWREAGNGQNTSEEKALVKLALIHSLQVGGENSNGEVYQKLNALLKDETLSLNVKMEIASILGSVQTPQSVQLLLGEYQQATDDGIREILRTQIARTGDVRSAGQFQEDLSPSLAAAWVLAKDDPKLAQVIAEGLAKVGSPSGVQLLVAALVDSGWNGENLADLKDPQARAA